MRRASRLFLTSARGLERSLERELQALRVPGHLEALPGGVLVSGTGESLWRAVLQSRLADSVELCLGEPFHAPDVAALDAGLRALPWEDCLRCAGPAPAALELRVSTLRSRLYHTRLLEERVRAAVAGRGPAAGAQAAPARPAPRVSVRLRHDACHVSVAASGPLHRRGYRSGGEPRLRETLAAACVLASPLLPRLAAAAASQDELVVWDPFCGSGVLLLEALGVVLGQPPGDRARRYPFAAFPCHAESEYADFLVRLHATPHPGLSGLTLLGTDGAGGEAERARRNLRRFQRRLWPLRAGGGREADASADGAPPAASPPVLPCSVRFEEAAAAPSARGLLGRPTLVLTSLLHSAGGAAVGQLGRLLQQHQADWRGVFCVASDAEDAKEQTGLEWTTELRFLNRGRWAALLQWTGHGNRGSPAGIRPAGRSWARR